MPKKPTDNDASDGYTDTEGIPARLKRLRLERGLSQRQLSAPGVSYAYISRIEAGTRRPSVKALRKLADKLGVSADYLETGSQTLVLHEHDPAFILAKLVIEAALLEEGQTELEREVLEFISQAEELQRPLARYMRAREESRRKVPALMRALGNYARASAIMAAAEKELRGALMNARGDYEE